MPAKWDNSFDISPLLNELERSKKIVNGRLIFSGRTDLESAIGVISTALNLSTEIDFYNKSNIIREGIQKVAPFNEVNMSNLLHDFKKLETNYLRRTQKKYTLVTNVSAIFPDYFSRFSINSATITLGALPSNFISEREKFMEWGQHHLYGKFPSSYTDVRISASGRTPSEAGEKALDAFDLLRAMINLFFNIRKRYKKAMGGPRIPVNYVLLGPLQSIHTRNGQYIPDMFFYNPLYIGPLETTRSIFSRIDKIRDDVSFIRGKLSKFFNKSFIEQSLLRYVRALDEIDYESSFLKMWGLIESLTLTTNAPYKITTKRTAYMFSNYEYHLSCLNHLRLRRNSLVHSATSSGDDSESLMYFAKYYAECLLMFYLHDGTNFKTFEEIKYYLNLTPTSSKLKSEKRILNFKYNQLRRK